MANQTGASQEVRLMALELIVADMIATVHRATSDPVQSIRIKRQRFQWFFEANKIAIGDSILHTAYPEEVQAALDELLFFGELLAQRRDLI